MHLAQEWFEKRYYERTHTLPEIRAIAENSLWKQKSEARRSQSKLYAIAFERKLVKIGVTTDMRKRYISLQMTSPVPLELLGWIPEQWAPEKLVHEVLSRWRLHGEWFSLSSTIESWIIQWPKRTIPSSWVRCGKRPLSLNTTTTTNHPEGLFRRPHSKFWWMSYYAFDPGKQKRVKVHRSTHETSQRKAKAVRVAKLEVIERSLGS